VLGRKRLGKRKAKRITSNKPRKKNKETGGNKKRKNEKEKAHRKSPYRKDAGNIKKKPKAGQGGSSDDRRGWQFPRGHTGKV